MEQLPDNPIDKSQWQALKDYVTECAKTLGLGLWRFELLEETEDDGVMGALHVMKVQSFNEYLAFHMRVYPVFWTLSPVRQRHYTCHELCHVINGERQRLVEGLEFCGVFGTREYTLFNTQYTYADERITDWFATLLAERLPMPVLAGTSLEQLRD